MHLELATWQGIAVVLLGVFLLVWLFVLAYDED